LSFAGATALFAQSDAGGRQLIGSVPSVAFTIDPSTGQTTQQQTVTVTSSGAGIVFAAVGSALTTSGGAQWLSVTPLVNTTPATLTVAVNTANLASGQYQGSINVAATDDSGAMLKIPVTLNLATPTSPGPPGGPTASGPLSASVSTMTFNVETSSTSDVLQKNISLTSTGAPVSFAAVGSAITTSGGTQWISVSPLLNTTPSTLVVTVTPAGLPAGQYQGSINIGSTDSSNVSLKIPVTLNLSPSPLLDLNPTGLAFTYSVGGPNPPDQFVTPTTTTAGLPYSVAIATSNGGSWLNATGSGATPAPVDVAVNPSGLQPGTYTGTLTFNAANVSNNPQTINVSLTVSNNPALTTNPTATSGLLFNYQIGQAVPGIQTVSVDSTVGSLGFSVAANQNTTSGGVAWLLLGSPSATATPANFSVAVNPAGMAPGQYTGSLVVTSAAAPTPVTIPVTLNVSNDAIPLVSVNPQTLVFTSQGGGIVTPQTVTVSSTGANVTYRLTANITTPQGGGWLLVSAPSGPASAGNPSTFFVGATPAGLPAGVYSATVTVQPDNGGPAVVIPVTLNAKP
jgi:hypothetical protein